MSQYEPTGREIAIRKALGFSDRPNSSVEDRTSERQRQRHDRELAERIDSDLAIPFRNEEDELAIIDEWQSARTKSLKRAVIGAGVFIFAIGLGGVTIDGAQPFGFEISEGRGVHIGFFFLILLLFNLAVFEMSRSIDVLKRAKRVKDIEVKIPKARARYEQLKQILSEHGVTFMKGFEPIITAPLISNINSKFDNMDRLESLLFPATKREGVLASIDICATRVIYVSSTMMLILMLFSMRAF